MKARYSILLTVTVLLAGWLTVQRFGLFPWRDASNIVRLVEERGSLQSFTATARTRVSCQGRMMVSDVKITRMQPNKCRIEYVSEPLKGVLVGSDGMRAWRFDPKTERLVVGSSTDGADDAAKLHLLLGNHKISLAGSKSVAGRDAYELEVRPKGSLRVKKRLWVDVARFVILGQADYDSHGKLQSSTRFTSIRFAGPFPDKLFESPTATNEAPGGPGDPMTLVKLSEAVGFTVRTPAYVPRGYKLDAYRLYACPCECPHQSAYIRYTNGLSSISVFESKMGSSCRVEAGCGKSEGPMGTCRVARADRDEIATLKRNGISFIVVADVGGRELKKILGSLN